MNIQTLSDFKRFLASEGATVTMIYHERGLNEKLSKPRKVEKVQSNAVMFEGGSWLYYEKAAAYDFEGDIVHVYWLDREGNRANKCMSYKLSN